MLKSSKHALKWFAENRWGMFVHWGLYSLLERNEWAQLLEEIPRTEYELLVRRFDGNGFNARKLAKLASTAGMTHMCMTTKHHEGFCLFDSKLTDYTSVKGAPAKRDFIGEYVEACRTEGLKVGLYYSLMDWHHSDWLALKRGDKKGHRRFLDYIHGQLRELCTCYGKIDMIFYDIPKPYEKPEEWQARQMNAMVKKLQPGLLVNDRNRLPGDYSTPEQVIVAQPEGRAWQSCMTLNENWGYSKGDDLGKSPKQVIELIRRTASQGGSLLMNVGLMPDGSIPNESAETFRAIGGWMKTNGESIYHANDRRCVLCAVGGHSIVNGNVYIHARDWNYPEIGIGAIENKVTRVTCLATGKPVRFRQDGTRLRLFELPECPPDPLTTVFRIETEGKLKIRKDIMHPECLW